MAKKGGSSHLKRIASPKYIPVARKGKKWLTKPSAGPHGLERSIALGVVLRDELHVADSLREVKKILTDGSVLVDGRFVREKKFPIGLMDIVSIPKLKKSYWVGVDTKGRFRMIEVDAEKAKSKLCRVEGKRSIRGGKFQISLHDGRTMVGGKEFTIGDTVRITVPEQKVLSVIKLEANTNCLITSGRHAGEVAIIDELYHKKGARRAEAKLHSDSESFITVRDYLFVVGDDAQVFK
ncbi:MAG: SSU ribosomal protein S4e [Candidatus Fermentimicrarchaeum limneticum]|uniref:Small ribosomal subunit protein eS4 n=1 Tax=Fermentimicrarchaeum limneticum TaxID=2795018 RepID=A0A7D6BV64_FERL1|nr:MAG: SSU ribosomal protein S4e [Candidatus Fermentimicrarchaeum limneticum]